MRQRNPLIEEKPIGGEVLGTAPATRAVVARHTRVKASRSPKDTIINDTVVRRRNSSMTRRRRVTTSTSPPDGRDDLDTWPGSRRGLARRDAELRGHGVRRRHQEEDTLGTQSGSFAMDLGTNEALTAEPTEIGNYALANQPSNLLPGQSWDQSFDGPFLLPTAPSTRIKVENTSSSELDFLLDHGPTIGLSPGPSPTLSLDSDYLKSAAPKASSRKTHAICMRGPTGDWEGVIAMFDVSCPFSLLSQKTARTLGLHLVPIPRVKVSTLTTPFGIVRPRLMAHSVGVRCGTMGVLPIAVDILVVSLDLDTADVVIGKRLIERLRGTGERSNLQSTDSSPRYDSTDDIWNTPLLFGLGSRHQGQFSPRAIEPRPSSRTETNFKVDLPPLPDPSIGLLPPSYPYQDDLFASNVPGNFMSVTPGDELAQGIFGNEPFDYGTLGIGDCVSGGSMSDGSSYGDGALSAYGTWF
ncbi:hypothetical protein G7046_g4163 [Stylonectria norvegica]|nr:hypothetical protein G7046_g4163 [Stylonectria norvegica]